MQIFEHWQEHEKTLLFRFIKRYFLHAHIYGIPKMAHAELVMVHPEEFCRYAGKTLTQQAEEE